MPPSPTERSPAPKRPRRDRDSEESVPESEGLIDAINRRDYDSDEIEPEPTGPTKVIPQHELDAIHRLAVDLKASIETMKASLEMIQRQVTVLENCVKMVVSELLYLVVMRRPLTIIAERIRRIGPQVLQ
jgi:hypothetical protein